MTSLVSSLTCDDCGHDVPLDAAASLCPSCGGLLEYGYDLGAAGDLVGHAAAHRGEGIWRWRALFPVDGDPVTLGEGDSPLLAVPALGAALDVPRLFVKNDGLMPTGSFKDRGFALAVTAARNHGATSGFTYSSGNAGSSFAAYAARAGMRATVLVEAAANEAKVAAIGLHGARVLRLHYESSTQVFDALDHLARRGFVSFVNFVNPVRHEAMKTYAYEICEALGWQAPDVMVHPVGTGGGLWGAWKGFRELYELGVIDRLPRMIGVQPAACAPLVDAVRADRPATGVVGDASATAAQSIAGDSMIHGGRRVLRAIRESGGGAVAVGEDELESAVRALGQHGVPAEPSAAASVAALANARATGLIDPADRVVAVVTGTALKQPGYLQRVVPPPAGDVRADADEWLRVLEVSA